MSADRLPRTTNDERQTTYKIGIDLGGTKIESILLGPDDVEQTRTRIDTPRPHDYTVIVARVCELIEQAMRGVPDGQPATVGIGIPGSINPHTGLVQNANTTCLIGRPLQPDIEARLGRSVGVENDANCFTQAECVMGAVRECGLVFGIIMGTGCGGAIAVDGHVRRGPNSIAGEWGHWAVDPQGAPCYCGNRGCVETKISGGGVERAFSERYGRTLSMREIADGFRTGDDQCSEAFLQFLDDFGRCLGGLISVLDPDAVVLGGGLSAIPELYTLGAEKVRRHAFHSTISTPILQNRLGDSAGVFGAAWIGRQNNRR